MSPGAANVYVYYRVAPADAPRLMAAARALHATWQAALPGLVCTLSRRVEAVADLLTLMETYAHVEGLSPASQHDIERAACEQLGAWIVGVRHVERFVPCA